MKPSVAEVRGVDQEPGAEAGERAEDRAAQERDRDQDDEDEVGAAAERRVGVEQRDLDEHREEEQRDRLDAVEDHVPAFACAARLCGFGIRTSTDSSEREVDERLHLDVLEEVGVGLADARDEADREVAREERGKVAAPAIRP